MAEPLRPAAIQTFGKKNYIFVPAGGIAAATYIPTAVEAGAASVLDITRILFADTTEPTQNTNVVDQERRYGDTLLFQFIGQTTFGGGQVHYQFDPQAAVGATGKKAYEKFTAGGSSGFFIQRLGVARATAVAAAQFVNVYPITVGPSFPSQAGSAESEEAGMTATFVITDTPAISVALT
jgi:hypothetical protein